MKLTERISPDVLIIAALMLIAGASVMFLGSLVAPPKTLMGRSMTAIPPSMFPNIVLTMLVILCAIFLVVRMREMPPGYGGGISTRGWQEGVSFFVLLTFYALAMKPLGFLMSTAMTMAAVSWLAGNRSILQIVILSVVAPVALYLAATRLLAVSLPELGFLELLYARLLDR